MVRIVDKRCTGKTSQLFLLAKENNGIIICSNPQLYQDKAYRLGISGIHFVSYINYLAQPEKYKGLDIYIDELETFLNILTSHRLKGYTVSVDDKS